MSKVVVVGAGLIGMMCARRLAREGAQVTLVERGQAGQESSWAGGGILSPLYPWRYDDAVNRLAQWSQQRYPDLLNAIHEESGVDPEWVQSGLLVLDPGEEPEATAWAARFGADMRILDADELEEVEPALGVHPDSALWLPQIAQVRNPRLTRALRGAVLHNGVQLLEGCKVTGLDIEDGRIRGVHTTQGTLAADQVVVAGGAWTAGLLAETGLQLAVEPVRGQMLLFKADPDQVRRISLYRQRYVIPRRDGHVLVGSTLERVGFDKSVTDEAREDLQAAAYELIPALADCPLVTHWAGLRPGSPSGIPYIGPHPGVDGLYVNVGHFRNGVILGPASVELLVEQMTGRPGLADPAPYLPVI